MGSQAGALLLLQHPGSSNGGSGSRSGVGRGAGAATMPRSSQAWPLSSGAGAATMPRSSQAWPLSSGAGALVPSSVMRSSMGMLAAAAAARPSVRAAGLSPDASTFFLLPSPLAPPVEVPALTHAAGGQEHTTLPELVRRVRAGKKRETGKGNSMGSGVGGGGGNSSNNNSNTSSNKSGNNAAAAVATQSAPARSWQAAAAPAPRLPPHARPPAVASIGSAARARGAMLPHGAAHAPARGSYATLHQVPGTQAPDATVPSETQPKGRRARPARPAATAPAAKKDGQQPALLHRPMGGLKRPPPPDRFAESARMAIMTAASARW
jgi:hypothetical protein